MILILKDPMIFFYILVSVQFSNLNEFPLNVAALIPAFYIDLNV